MLDALLANILNSSAIEGEKLNASSVRSSLANKPGLTEAEPFPTTERTDGLADIRLDAVENLDSDLSLERILGWHQRLFVEGGALFNPVVAGQLRGNEPMQVVSGRLDRPVVHYEAPGRDCLDAELSRFFQWFNESSTDPSLDPLLRAGIAHFWFITLHPLDDGNGRITRLITDLALAQAERQSVRFYAMSVAILANRKGYYDVLEQSQRGTLDITAWLSWFLNTLDDAFDEVLTRLDQTIFKTCFWQQKDQTQLSNEMVKVLNRMLDGDFLEGINTSQYHKVAKVSKPTASRHLAQLVAQGYLVKNGAGGRSTRYLLAGLANQAANRPWQFAAVFV
ncbi:MAG: Fic family protein [Pontibacterium sp.]